MRNCLLHPAFLGLANFNQRWDDHFAKPAAHLTEVTSKKAEWKWDQEQQEEDGWKTSVRACTTSNCEIHCGDRCIPNCNRRRNLPMLRAKLQASHCLLQQEIGPSAITIPCLWARNACSGYIPENLAALLAQQIFYLYTCLSAPSSSSPRWLRAKPDGYNYCLSMTLTSTTYLEYATSWLMA